MQVVDQNEVRKTLQVLQTGHEFWEYFDCSRRAAVAGGLDRHTCQVFEWGMNGADGVELDADIAHGRIVDDLVLKCIFEQFITPAQRQN